MPETINRKSKVTIKQARMAQAKAKGKKLKEIAAEEYPNAKESSGVVQVSKELNKSHVAQYLEQSKLQALKEHDITWSRIIKPISDGLDASSQIRDKDGVVIVEVPDLNTRMRASKQAADLLRVKDEIDPDSSERFILPEGLNELEIQRLLFKKGE